MRWIDSSRRRWYLLAACWVGLLVIGMGGFIEQSHEGDLGRGFLDNLYLTLQLATLDYDGGSTALNWRLEIARFVAPVMAAGTVLQTASVVFRDQFLRWRIGFSKGHTVVCGLGPAGTRLAIALAREGHPVVGVDADPAASGLAALRDADVPALAGDPTDAEVLLAARVDRAAQVVAFDRDDAANVAVTAAVRAVPRHGNDTALRCSVHLTDAELTELLRGADLGGSSDVRVEFFNLHERGARALLGEVEAFGDGSRPPHLVVVGMGQLGRSLVVAAAQQWAEVGQGPLVVSLVDRDAAGRWNALLLQHPALEAAADARCLAFDLEAPTADMVQRFTTVLLDEAPTAVAVVLADESLALSTSLFVHKTLGRPSVPVVVRTSADAGLAGIVTSTGTPDPHQPARFPGLVLFPFLDRTCSPAIIEGGVREQLARAIHEDHTARAGHDGGLHRPWDQLDDAERESSRRAADGIVDTLADVGFELVPLRRWGAAEVPFTDAEVERLARVEHERWRAERQAQGWRHGPSRDDDAKLNPLLVAWVDAPAEAQAANRDAVRTRPGMLARAGFELARS